MITLLSLINLFNKGFPKRFSYTNAIYSKNEIDNQKLKENARLHAQNKDFTEFSKDKTKKRF